MSCSKIVVLSVIWLQIDIQKIAYETKLFSTEAAVTRVGQQARARLAWELLCNIAAHCLGEWTWV